MSELTDEEIIDRIKYADNWIKPFRDNDITASNAYIDVNNGFGTDDGIWDEMDSDGALRDTADVPTAIPVGQPNYATINNEIKTKAVITNPPKLHIQANEDPNMDGFPGAPIVVQQAWQQAYEKWNYERVLMSAWQKRGICGLGCIWYRWDTNNGFQLESITSNRLLIDPHATTFSNLRYAGVKIRMPLSMAEKRYPNKADAFKDSSGSLDVGVDLNKERRVITITLYFDNENEIHVYQDEVLYRDKNRYRRIPLEFRLGTIDPRDRLLPLGDNVLVRGLNQQRADLSSIASNVAKHGGPITLADGNYFSAEQEVALQNGSSQQIIICRKAINPGAPPIHRIPGEQLSPAFGVALQDVSTTLDSAMGTSPNQRGEAMVGETATASVMTARKAGAAAKYDERQFEKMCTRIAQEFVFCCATFGGPDKDKPETELPESKQLWKAFCAVKQVRMIEGSSSFSNSGMELQESMQLYTTVVTSLQAWFELAAKGAVTKIPKIEMIFNDMLSASGRQNTEEYWEQAPPPPQGPSTVPPDIAKALQSIYPESNPDIQRQIEKILGLQPSQMPPKEEAQPQDHAIAAMKAEMAMQQSKIAAEHDMQQSDHVHEMRMQILELQKEIKILEAKAHLTPKENPSSKPKTGEKKE